MWTGEIVRLNKVGLSLLIRWIKQYSEGGQMIVKLDEDVIAKKEYRKLQKLKF